MQNQMNTNLAGYQKSLADQGIMFQQQISDLNTGYTTQLSDMDKSYKTQITDLNTKNQQAMQTLGAQLSPKDGAQVLGIKAASGPNNTQQKLRRAGVGGSFSRAGLRIQNINV